MRMMDGSESTCTRLDHRKKRKSTLIVSTYSSLGLLHGEPREDLTLYMSTLNCLGGRVKGRSGTGLLPTEIAPDT